MVLNYIWVGFILIAFIAGVLQFVIFHNVDIFQKIMSGAFDMSKTGFEVSLGLTGVLTLWMGLMKVGEEGGVVRLFAKLVNPFFKRIFPEIPENHPAIGAMLMNITANMLGLDNAATPMGLKAMEELQTLNPKKDTASNAQIMFLVLNASGLTLIPVSIMVYRSQMGAKDAADVFIPILICTFFATMSGLISVSIYQRINLFNKVILAYLSGLSLLVGSIIWYFSTLSPTKIPIVSGVVSNFILLCLIVSFVTLAVRRKINVYETFIEGAKEGFQTAVKIIPYLIAILVAIGMFRASGAMDFLMNGIASFVKLLGINSDFVAALPVALMKPLSGSGARGLMVETMKSYGADSFVGRLSCVMQGTTDTTFYIIAVYFGSVGIKKTRYAITCGLIADVVGLSVAVLISYLFFHS